MLDILNLPLTELLKRFKKRELRCSEVVEATIRAIDDAELLNAFVAVDYEGALRMARESDERYMKGTARALEGVPYGVKDNFCTLALPTTASSNILKGFVAPYESTVTQRLSDNGAIAIGKLNMDEFAMGSSNETSAYGPVISPWRRSSQDRLNAEYLVPGGSSGGSAAAVAARLCFGALGSDTGGSIRQPAALTGLVGLKPTYGLCSRWGMIAYASSLDQPGPLTRTVHDSALMLQAIAGHDPRDSTSVLCDVPNYMEWCKASPKDLVVGIPKEYRLESITPEVIACWDQVIQKLKDYGVTLREVSLPHTHYALPVYYIISTVEASSNLSRYDGVRFGVRENAETVEEMYCLSRGRGFGEEVISRIIIGTYLLSKENKSGLYQKATILRSKIRQDFVKVFDQGVHAILCPTTIGTAFKLNKEMQSTIEMYQQDILTVPANIAGLPALSVPAGVSDQGLPIGVQLIGNVFQEGQLLTLAQLIEEQSEKITYPDAWWSKKTR